MRPIKRAIQAVSDWVSSDISRLTRLSACLVVSLYFLTRVGNLFRDLAFEEAQYLMAGVNWISGRGYYFDWGVFYPHANACGHPPLTAILLGIFSGISYDLASGGRLVPFLINLFACLIPLLITRSIIPSLLILMSPLMLGASGHMQTDPTAGLLGYSVICIGIASRRIELTRRTIALFSAGLVVLWLAKLETAIIASFLIFLHIVLYRGQQRGKLFLSFVLASALGVGTCVLVTWLLGRSAGVIFAQSVGYTFDTVVRVTSGTLKAHAQTASQGAADRVLLLRYLGDFKITHFLLICTLVPLSIMSGHRTLFSLRKPHLFLLIGGLLPFAVYLLVGWPGDGFPRYFVIAFPFLSTLLGLCLRELSRNARWACGALVLGIGAITMLPQTWQAMLSPGSVTVFRGERGARESARLVASLLKPGEGSFAPYRESDAQAMAMAPELRAAVITRSQWQQGIQGKLVEAIQQRGARLFQIGSYFVVVEKDDRPAPLLGH
jgi:hypothetical protein